MAPTDDTGHERTDANTRAIALVGLGLAAVTAAALVVVVLQLDLLSARADRADRPPSPLVAERPEAPPEPRLQTTPASDLAAVRAGEEKVLGSYAWVDRPAGVVRIPIARAKELLLRAEGP